VSVSSKLRNCTFCGGCILNELSDEIEAKSQYWGVAKSVYIEAIFGYWESEGCPDFDVLRAAIREHKKSEEGVSA